MSIKNRLSSSIKFQQCRAWNVDGKFYHSIFGAIDALTDEIDNRIRLRSYYRQGILGINHRRAQVAARVLNGFYSPNGFYEQWLIRLRRRVQIIVLSKYNKKLK